MDTLGKERVKQKVGPAPLTDRDLLRCPRCAGMIWYFADVVAREVGGERSAAIALACGDCGYRSLLPSATQAGAPERSSAAAPNNTL